MRGRGSRPSVLGVYKQEWKQTLGALDSFLYRLRVALLAAPRESPGRWTVGPDCPARRYEAPNAVIDGRLFVIGGFTGLDLQALTRVDVLDLSAGTWSRGPALPLPLTHSMTAVDGPRIWLVGGYVGDHPGPVDRRSLFLDTRERAWHEGPPLPVARASGALVRRGRVLHFFGGYLDRETASASHFSLSLDGDTRWRERAPLPGPRGHHSAAVVGEAIYAIGGQFGHDTDPEDVPLVHAYSEAEDAWRAVAPLPDPRSHFETSTFVHEGRIVIVGGLNRTRRLLRIRGLPNITSYDPTADRWTELPPLPVGLFAPCAALLGDRVVVSCGSDLLRPDGAQRATLLQDAFCSKPGA